MPLFTNELRRGVFEYIWQATPSVTGGAFHLILPYRGHRIWC